MIINEIPKPKILYSKTIEDAYLFANKAVQNPAPRIRNWVAKSYLALKLRANPGFHATFLSVMFNSPSTDTSLAFFKCIMGNNFFSFTYCLPNFTLTF